VIRKEHDMHEPVKDERVGSAEEICRLQAAALAELAQLAEDLRCHAADLCDEVRTMGLNPGYLLPVSAVIDDKADELARAARGYRDVQANDMLYPGVLDDLRVHGWGRRPDRELGGMLPPVPVTELRAHRGYRRGWKREGERITLWFTAPGAIAYACASGRGALHSSGEIREALAASPAGKRPGAAPTQ
jgi:hypothetical protein